MNLKNIIFDLGGVLLNIDYRLTQQAFKDLGVKDFDKVYSFASQTHLFDRMDKGTISPEEFRDRIREASGLPLKDEEIDNAWNAMILDYPPNKIPFLEEVKGRYRTFLLSNTNAIHYPTYTDHLKKAHGYDSLAGLFEKHYLSYEMGMRKPDTEIFEFVLQENGLKGEETLFFDDTLQHVEGARKAGLWAYWIDVEKEDVIQFFENGQLTAAFLKKLQNQSQPPGQ